MRSHSIRRQLTLIVVAPAFLVLVFACGAMVLAQAFNAEREARNRLAALARVLGSQGATTLSARDSRAAEEDLSALSTEPGLMAAFIYDAQGIPFAAYPVGEPPRHAGPSPAPGRAGASVSDRAGDEFLMAGSQVHLFLPVQRDGERIGTIHLVGDQRKMHPGAREYQISGAVIMGVALSLTLWLRLRLQRLVWGPLRRLSLLMSRVSGAGSDSAPGTNDDRGAIGQLADGIDTLLETVAQRDQALALCGQRLEQQVEVRTRPLAEENEAAQAALEAQSRRLVRMTDEIRTPMNDVLGFAELLLGARLDEGQQFLTANIRRAGDRALAVIDGVLGRPGFDPGHLELALAPFSLRDGVEELIRQFREPAALRGLRLSYRIDEQVPRMVRGDAARYRQIVAELLRHALRFPANAEVKVRVSAHSVGPGGRQRIDTEVGDFGIGIVPDQQAAHQSYDPGDSSSRPQFDGAGLGLAAACQLAELMGGGIGLQVRPGQGACLCFHLAADAVADPVPVGPAEADRGGRRVSAEDSRPRPVYRGRVLLVEDNPVNQEVACLMLEHLGCQVQAVADGRQAVAAALAQAFDLVLMDVQMPEMDGTEASRRIRAGEEGSGLRTPIVAVTAHALPHDMERLSAQGMDDYLSKPYTESQLRELLSRFLSPADPVERVDGSEVAVTPEPAAARDSVPILDPAALAQIRSIQRPGAPDLLTRVIDVFFDDTPALLAQLEQALTEGDAEAVRRAAHRFKSGAANLGARGLASMCEALEHQAARGGVADGSAQFLRIDAEYKRVAEALRRERRQSEP